MNVRLKCRHIPGHLNVKAPVKREREAQVDTLLLTGNRAAV